MSAVLVPLFFHLLDPAQGISLLFWTHAGIFAGIGAAGGLALGWGLGDWRTVVGCLIGGLIGSFAGVFAFEALNSLAFPLVPTFVPVPAERIPRLLVHLCVAMGTAAVAGLAVGGVRGQSGSTQPAG
jgi:hypothetical protein